MHSGFSVLPYCLSTLYNFFMTINDVSLLGKKILVGVIVTLIPFIIIFGGLWLTKKLLSDSHEAKPVPATQIKST